MAILRRGDLFQWHTVAFLALVVYVYSVEVERRSWNVLLAGLAFYGLEWLLEIGNALVLKLSGHSALWTTPGQTSFLILCGLTIEISFMFAIAGITFTKNLPVDPRARILGLNNRLFLSVAFALFCVAVEVWLNHIGALVWTYSFWSFPHVWLVFLIGYLPYFLLACWVHDHPRREVQVGVVVALFSLDAVLLAVFAGVLGWI